MANSNKKYSKRRSINKNRNNYAKKNVLNKQSRLSQKGGLWCDKSKKTINKLESIKKNIEDDLSKEVNRITKLAELLEIAPKIFQDVATKYAQSKDEYSSLVVGPRGNPIALDDTELTDYMAKYKSEYMINRINLIKCLNLLKNVSTESGSMNIRDEEKILKNLSNKFNKSESLTISPAAALDNWGT
jgi:hypothetical protein